MVYSKGGGRTAALLPSPVSCHFSAYCLTSITACSPPYSPPVHSAQIYSSSRSHIFNHPLVLHSANRFVNATQNTQRTRKCLSCSKKEIIKHLICLTLSIFVCLIKRLQSDEDITRTLPALPRGIEYGD